tara:strand:+ start:63 stop:353 length:291 start_codon:yes stop_codon:yes gene_type:complete
VAQVNLVLQHQAEVQTDLNQFLLLSHQQVAEAAVAVFMVTLIIQVKLEVQVAVAVQTLVQAEQEILHQFHHHKVIQEVQVHQEVHTKAVAAVAQAL